MTQREFVQALLVAHARSHRDALVDGNPKFLADQAAAIAREVDDLFFTDDTDEEII